MPTNKRPVFVQTPYFVSVNLLPTGDTPLDPATRTGTTNMGIVASFGASGGVLSKIRFLRGDYGYTFPGNVYFYLGASGSQLLFHEEHVEAEASEPDTAQTHYDHVFRIPVPVPASAILYFGSEAFNDPDADTFRRARVSAWGGKYVGIDPAPETEENSYPYPATPACTGVVLSSLACDRVATGGFGVTELFSSGTNGALWAGMRVKERDEGSEAANVFFFLRNSGTPACRRSGDFVLIHEMNIPAHGPAGIGEPLSQHDYFFDRAIQVPPNTEVYVGGESGGGATDPTFNVFPWVMRY